MSPEGTIRVVFKVSTHDLISVAEEALTIPEKKLSLAGFSQVITTNADEILVLAMTLSDKR